MSTCANLNISLTPQMDQFVQSRVKSGRYRTPSEVISEALRLLQEREQARENALEEVRARLRRAAQRAGQGEPADRDEMLKAILRRSEQRRTNER